MARLTGWQRDKPHILAGQDKSRTGKAIRDAVQASYKEYRRTRDEKGPLSAEQGMVHDAEKFNIRTGVFLFGTTVTRPNAEVLKDRGVNGMLFLDIDDLTLYKWNGKEWSS